MTPPCHHELSAAPSPPSFLADYHPLPAPRTPISLRPSQSLPALAWDLPRRISLHPALLFPYFKSGQEFPLLTPSTLFTQFLPAPVLQHQAAISPSAIPLPSSADKGLSLKKAHPGMGPVTVLYPPPPSMQAELQGMGTQRCPAGQDAGPVTLILFKTKSFLVLM